MAQRTALIAPVLVCTMLSPALAFAAPPAEATADPSVTEAAADTPEPVVVESADAAPVEGPAVAEPAEASAPESEVAVDEVYDDFEEDFYDDYESSYEPKRTTLELQSGYFGIGIAPGMTIHDRGFHPNTRFEMEFGGTLEHDYRDLALSFGVVSHVTPYYGRKTPSYGADVTATAMLGPVYLRTGLGAVGGLPRGHVVHDTAAGIGGVVGAGLNFNRAPMVRVGVDYDFRVTTQLEPIHTVFIALRVACCRED